MNKHAFYRLVAAYAKETKKEIIIVSHGRPNKKHPELFTNYTRKVLPDGTIKVRVYQSKTPIPEVEIKLSDIPQKFIGKYIQEI